MPRILPIAILLVLVVAGIVVFSLMRGEDTAVLDELLAADRAFAAMSRAEGPGPAFAAYLIDAAIQLPHGGEPVRGRVNIAAGFDDAPDLALDWTPENGGVARSNDLGWTWGRYTATRPGTNGEAQRSHGKYLNIWVRDAEGRWRVQVDMGNS